MKDISEDFTDTVNVDFVDVPVFEERLGFYKTYRSIEQATPIVLWVLDMKASGCFSSQYMAPYSCHQSHTRGPLGAKNSAITCGGAYHGRWEYKVPEVKLSIEQLVSSLSCVLGIGKDEVTLTFILFKR